MYESLPGTRNTGIHCYCGAVMLHKVALCLEGAMQGRSSGVNVGGLNLPPFLVISTTCTIV